MIQVTISKKAALLLIVGALLLVPLTAVATHLFGDVADDNIHSQGIGWVKDAGVTQGCGGGDYCPKQAVTREQMATFMYRLSGNDPATEPSVRAASAVVAERADNVYYATVSPLGTLTSGNAESAEWVDDIPGYRVQFDADLRSCTGVASAGDNGTASGGAWSASRVSLANPNEDIATVSFWSSITESISDKTGFHLMIVCP